MVCPFINTEDVKCADNLKLDKIDFAVAVCGDEFTRCEIFWQMMSKMRDESAAKRASVA
jgi:hypothetical protein